MSAMKIRAPHHAKGDSNRYCGPSAISAVTPLTTGEAARLIRSFRPGAVRGTHAYELGRAFQQVGVKMVQHGDLGIGTQIQPTLAKWIELSRGIRTAGRVFLLCAGNHWQVISGNRFVCGIAGAVVDFKHKAVKRRSWVTMVFELKQEAPILKVPAKAKKTTKAHVPMTREDVARRAFKRLAKLHQADLEWTGGRDALPIVYGLLNFEIDEDMDPHAGDHLPDSWTDALERLQKYIKIKESLT